MNADLNQVERDFIEFFAEYSHRSAEEVARIFIATRNHYRFECDGYNALTGEIAYLYRLLYDPATERGAVVCYQTYALLHLFRFLSYTYPKPRATLVREFIRDIRKGEFGNLYHFFRRKLHRLKPSSPAPSAAPDTARFLLKHSQHPPVVVDYGCGLAYTSLEIVRLQPQTRIFLVDIDCITLDFALFRFGKIRADVAAIRVTQDNLYPPLPDHTLCIAREVMEHIHQPLRVYDNILDGLSPGGLLYGSFDDHKPNLYHLSPNLAEIRNRLAVDFEYLGHHCYRKKCDPTAAGPRIANQSNVL